MKDKLEQFLSVTMKLSNTPRLLNLYVSFIVTRLHVLAKKTIRVHMGAGFIVFAVLCDAKCVANQKYFYAYLTVKSVCVTNDTQQNSSGASNFLDSHSVGYLAVLSY